MSYNLTWSDSTKPNIVVAPGTFDTASTSLTLSGKGALNYGESQQMNFMHLLENFAAPTSPANPTRGQIWYNVATSKLNVYNGSAWISAAGGVTSGAAPQGTPQAGDLWWNTTAGRAATSQIPTASAAATSGSGLNIFDGSAWTTIYSTVTNSAVGSTSQVRVAYIDEYNAMANAYNKVACTPTGTTYATGFGYGQTPIPLATTTMSNTDWVNLLTKLKAVAQHQGLAAGVISGIDTKGFIYESGSDISYGIVGMLGYRGNGSTIADVVGKYATTKYASDNLEAGRFNAVVGSLESSSPAQGSRVRTDAWSGSVTHQIDLTFLSANALKGFFNSGGKLSLAISVSATPSTAVNLAWNALTTKIGTVTLSASGTTVSGTQALGTTSKGIYDITTAPQSLFVATASAAYSNETVQITASTDATGKVLTLVVTLVSTGSCSGITTSALTMTKASSTYLNSPVIAYPTVSSSGTL